MNQYHLIQLDGDYLTDGALVGGARAVTAVKGLSDLLKNRLSTIDYAIDGTPVKQYSENKGSEIEISFPKVINTEMLQAIIAANNTAEDGDTTLPLIITAPLGTFTMTVVPVDFEVGDEAPLEAGFKGVKFTYAVATVAVS